MISAVILAGGSGSRFGSWIPKPWMSLNGRAVIDWSLDAFAWCDEIIVVADKPYKEYRWVQAGATRTESAHNGTLTATGDIVIIHDAVRPFVTEAQTRAAAEAVEGGCRSVTHAIPVTDGVLVDRQPVLKRNVTLTQTPEAFPRDLLLTGFGLGGVWESETQMLFWSLGIPTTVLPGVAVNMKLTVPSDLAFAEGLLPMMQHPVVAGGKPGRTLVLGGSGDIGKAVCDLLDNYSAPPRAGFDLSSDWTVDLTEFGAVLHTAGSTGNDLWAVNYTSVVSLLQQAEAQDWRGNIVIVGSTAATYGRQGAAEYSASKAAAHHYVQAEHRRLASKGIRVNIVAPAKVQGRLQLGLNPDADLTLMLTPAQVAERIVPYLSTGRHGVVDFMRVGL